MTRIETAALDFVVKKREMFHKTTCRRNIARTVDAIRSWTQNENTPRVTSVPSVLKKRKESIDRPAKRETVPSCCGCGKAGEHGCSSITAQDGCSRKQAANNNSTDARHTIVQTTRVPRRNLQLFELFEFDFHANDISGVFPVSFYSLDKSCSKFKSS